MQIETINLPEVSALDLYYGKEFFIGKNLEQNRNYYIGLSRILYIADKSDQVDIVNIFCDALDITAVNPTQIMDRFTLKKTTIINYQMHKIDRHTLDYIRIRLSAKLRGRIALTICISSDAQ